MFKGLAEPRTLIRLQNGHNLFSMKFTKHISVNVRILMLLNLSGMEPSEMHSRDLFFLPFLALVLCSPVDGVASNIFFSTVWRR